MRFIGQNEFIFELQITQMMFLTFILKNYEINKLKIKNCINPQIRNAVMKLKLLFCFIKNK